MVAHPSADVYGSDLQLVESVVGLRSVGWEVIVCLPVRGPLVARLTDAGARVHVRPFPVLRKSLLGPVGLLRLLLGSMRALPWMTRLLHGQRPDVVYMNTVTAPLWLVAARLAARPVLAHVHEAEDALPRWLARALNAPLLLARTVVVNSRAAESTLLRAVPAVRDRTVVVYNGVAGPEVPVEAPDETPGSPRRLVLVGRISPRKGPDVAVEALVELLARGRDVVLDICGSTFVGYEWFEEQLRRRIDEAGLATRVRLLGYTSPTWPVLARADVVLVPSRAEPFGNTAVEGQLACRPVVASDVQGLREIVESGRTGVLVPPGDAAALATAVDQLLSDPKWSRSLALAGQASAQARFGIARYHGDIDAAVARTRSR